MPDHRSDHDTGTGGRLCPGAGRKIYSPVCIRYVRVENMLIQPDGDLVRNVQSRHERSANG